ncbi:MAG: hypothetical protein WB821_02370 [Burkholderiaceae bacterium]
MVGVTIRLSLTRFIFFGVMIMMKKSLAALALAAAMSSGVQAQPAGGAGLDTLSTGAKVAIAFVAAIVIGAASSSSTSHN